MSRRPLIAGNWKMHNTLVEARALMKGLRDKLGDNGDVEVLVCPPFTLLYPMGKEIDGTSIKLGAQNAHFEPKGAFTGEISPIMLKACNCTYVIIGHSERRHVFGETDELLRRKVTACTQAGLNVIFCVGETLDQRESGQTAAVVEAQVQNGLPDGVDPSALTLAYEPVWAIGTGRNATAEQAQEVHGILRRRIGERFDAAASTAMRILYGGSVKPGNAAELLACPDVDGALVGGACLVADDFASIIHSARASVCR